MRWIRAHALVACLTLSAASAVSLAQDSNDLTLNEAVGLTLARNPGLRSFDYQLRAQDARIDRAAQKRALELSGEIENVAGTGQVRGASSAESTLALSGVIELGSKRERRIDVARLNRENTLVALQAAQLDYLAEVTRRFVHVASDQKQLELTREAVRLAQVTVEAVERRVNAAASPQVELHRARVELSRAELELEHAEHELRSSRTKLAAMWGETKPDFAQVSADLYSLPDPGSFESLVQLIERNPDFLEFTTLERLRDAEQRLAEAHRRPDVTLSAGVRRFEEADDQGFVFRFAVPLGSRARAAPDIAEASALKQQVNVDREAALVNARAQLFEIYQELRHAITEAETLRDRVLPQMQEALRATEYAYQRGRYGYLEWVDAQRAYIDVQRALIEAAANAHNFRTELERLTGEPLATHFQGSQQ